MCVICRFQPGFTPPKSVICNAVHNNPHGFGLIIKKDNKLNVIKRFREEGNDPDEIYDLLKDNEDAERFLHVRWKTAGAISEENTQPFQVYKSDDKEVWFAHNGTLNQYSNYNSHWQNKQDNTESDSKIFAETVLKKYLPKLSGEAGIADIQDEFIQEILMKYWSTGLNRGILVSSVQEPFFFNKNDWKTIKTKEVIDGKEVTGEFFASNDSYFEKVSRGPLYEKMEAERKKREEEQRSKIQTREEKKVGILTSLGFMKQYGLSELGETILEDFDFYQREGYIHLANLTYYELMQILESLDQDDRTTLVLYLTSFLKEDGTALVETQAKLERATKRISELKARLKDRENVSKAA